MEFLLGCNYWASNADTEMWRPLVVRCEALIDEKSPQGECPVGFVYYRVSVAFFSTTKPAL